MTIENHAIRDEPPNMLAWVILFSTIIMGGAVLIRVGYFVDWLVQ